MNRLTVMGVQGDLILCSVTDETLSVRERDIGWRCPVSLIVCDDFYTIILPDTDTRVGSAEIDTDSLDHDYLWLMIRA